MFDISKRLIVTFDDIPLDLEISDDRTGLALPAKYVGLTRDLCRDKIDKVWWNPSSLPKEVRKEEPDHTWRWAQKFGEVRADHGGHMYGWGIETIHDGVLQGAILYGANSTSMLDEGPDGDPPPAVWLAYLATAPWNRSRVTAPEPGFHSGVGTALLRMAIAHSYFRQGEGRVNGSPVEHPDTLDWYERRGFVRCEGIECERVLIELPVSAAKRYLAEWGLS